MPNWSGCLRVACCLLAGGNKFHAAIPPFMVWGPHSDCGPRIIAESLRSMDSLNSVCNTLWACLHGMAPVTPSEYAGMLFLAIVSYFLLRYAPRDPRLAHLPPHVRGRPIINQTLDHLQEDPTGTRIQWARDYGEIFCTKAATTTFIWINTREAFKELIDRRSAIYAAIHSR